MHLRNETKSISNIGIRILRRSVKIMITPILKYHPLVTSV
jgi:hypothetical protein